MTEEPRIEQDTALPDAALTPTRPAPPGLRSLDLGLGAAAGMVCDIDDPDCNPMAFAGTSGASSMTGQAGEDSEASKA